MERNDTEDNLVRSSHPQNAQANLLARHSSPEHLLNQSEWLRTTLASIGDAVISTDAEGRIHFMNSAAESLTGWTFAEAVGHPLPQVFRIINEDTREPAENPAMRALREGKVVGLANHTLLIARDGSERPIDDSAAPIRNAAGTPGGAVLVFRDVSERRRAEHDRARLAAIVESSEDAIVSKSLDGIIRSWNAAAERLFGHTAAEAVGKPITLIIPPERLNEEPVILERLRRGERVEHFETVRVTKDGRRIDISLTISPLRNRDGQVIGASKIARDITAQKKAEEALRQSEARYRAIVEATPECVKLVGADGTLKQMNQAGLAMLDADETFLGQSFYNVIAPEYRDAFRSFNERVCRGEGGTFQFDVIGLKGTRRRMESTSVPLSAPEGFTHLAVTRDVTEQANSRARLEYAVRASGVGFWYCDLPFDELIWDERVKEHFWLPPDARVTIDLFYQRIHPEDREKTRLAIEQSIRDRIPYDVDYRTVDPTSGAIKWVRALGGTTYGPGGEPTRFDGVTLDITARKLDEERLASLYQELRQQDRRKDEFLALLAHELRNPLAPLRNGLQVLRLAGGDTESADPVREMMDRQLTHMVRLIDDLLDVSRISRNKMELRRSRVPLAEVIKSAVETARPLIDAGGHELIISQPPQPIFLDADLTRLAQVFSNLLTNSAKYTPPGGRIWLTARVEHGEKEQVVVSVRDTGIGIPKEALPTIFDMFSQVDRSIERSTGGLGIGLALVKGLVEMHGGHVTAESEGQGSTFTVTLPVLSQPRLADMVIEGGQGKAGAKRRILVVDDNRDGADSLAMVLRLLGNEVRTANDGLDALEVAEVFRPDTILMDVGMPRLNGLDATRRIREKEWGREIIIIALTGWGQQGDRERSHEAGCDGHLVKPVNLPDLQNLLAELAGGGS